MSDPGFVPYGKQGTGDAGNATSQVRRILDDTTGRAGRRRQRVLQILSREAFAGATCGEVERAMNEGHGAVSSALSHLHRAGLVSRLNEARDKMEVYVLNEHVGDRELSPYRPRQQIDTADVDRMIHEARRHAWFEGATAISQELLRQEIVDPLQLPRIDNPYQRSTDEQDSDRDSQGDHPAQ